MLRLALIALVISLGGGMLALILGVPTGAGRISLILSGLLLVFAIVSAALGLLAGEAVF